MRSLLLAAAFAGSALAADCTDAESIAFSQALIACSSKMADTSDLCDKETYDCYYNIKTVACTESSGNTQTAEKEALMGKCYDNPSGTYSAYCTQKETETFMSKVLSCRDTWTGHDDPKRATPTPVDDKVADPPTLKPTHAANLMCNSDIYWCLKGVSATTCVTKDGSTQAEEKTALVEACEDWRSDMANTNGCTNAEIMAYVDSVNDCATKMDKGTCPTEADKCLTDLKYKDADENMHWNGACAGATAFIKAGDGTPWGSGDLDDDPAVLGTSYVDSVYQASLDLRAELDSICNPAASSAALRQISVALFAGLLAMFL